MQKWLKEEDQKRKNKTTSDAKQVGITVAVEELHEQLARAMWRLIGCCTKLTTVGQHPVSRVLRDPFLFPIYASFWDFFQNFLGLFT